MAGTEAGLLVAESVATRVHEAPQEPFDLGGVEFFTSASLGVSLFPQDATDATSLLKNADTAMYQSKKAEPGGSVVFSSGGDDAVARSVADHPTAPCGGASTLGPALATGRRPRGLLGHGPGGADPVARSHRRHRATRRFIPSRSD